MSEVDQKYDKYGIVIDAGSSGSRIQIYKWPDPSYVLEHKEEFPEEHLRSVPQIFQHETWTKKTTPGLSSYGEKPHKAYKNHMKPLLEYAEEIIPKNKLKDTPIFIQATAGMRLLSENKREDILENLCKGIRKSHQFLLSDCEAQIQVIDGETEGVYGWMGLNYLMGNLNDYNPSSHVSDGFMDMGGASTQIAFVPTDANEIAKHREDISTIFMKNVDGSVQQWDIFVSTWLGFGANEARRRYLSQLINSLPENSNWEDDDDYTTRVLTDPCLPKNSEMKYEYKDIDFKLIGSGNYEQCSKSIYPLLLKHLPCVDEPCLFNGVHAPKIDFYKDRFVGISEYWYTANDVFKSGGEYNFGTFSAHVKEFCESDWSTINKKSKEGFYNNLPDKMLLDSCFKANWVLNVLHEGFSLPRIDIDESMDPSKIDSPSNSHVPFQSAGSIDGAEVSWTLGKILLYAASTVPVGPSDKVGFLPSTKEMEHTDKEFIPGWIKGSNGNKTTGSQANSSWGFVFFLLAFFAIVYALLVKKFNKDPVKMVSNALHHIQSLVPIKYSRASSFEDFQIELEEGNLSNGGHKKQPFDGVMDEDRSTMRSRSLLSLPELSPSPVQDNYRPKDKKENLRSAFSMADFSKFNKTPSRTE